MTGPPEKFRALWMRGECCQPELDKFDEVEGRNVRPDDGDGGCPGGDGHQNVLVVRLDRVRFKGASIAKNRGREGASLVDFLDGPEKERICSGDLTLKRGGGIAFGIVSGRKVCRCTLCLLELELLGVLPNFFA